MHDARYRLYAVGGFTRNTLLALAVLHAITARLFFPPTPTARVTLDVSQPVLVQQRTVLGERVERAVFSYNVTANLSSLFNWNTKQVHFYVAAEYERRGQLHSEVVLLDRMLRTPQEAENIQIHVDGSEEVSYYCSRSGRTGWLGVCRYLLVDASLRGTTLKIVPRWNVISIVGLLTSGSGTAAVVTLP